VSEGRKGFLKTGKKTLRKKKEGKKGNKVSSLGGKRAEKGEKTNKERFVPKSAKS